MFPELNCKHETENDVSMRIVHNEMLQTSKIKKKVYVGGSQPAQKPLLFVQIL